MASENRTSTHIVFSQMIGLTIQNLDSGLVGFSDETGSKIPTALQMTQYVKFIIDMYMSWYEE